MPGARQLLCRANRSGSPTYLVYGSNFGLDAWSEQQAGLRACFGLAGVRVRSFRSAYPYRVKQV